MGDDDEGVEMNKKKCDEGLSAVCKCTDGLSWTQSAGPCGDYTTKSVCEKVEGSDVMKCTCVSNDAEFQRPKPKRAKKSKSKKPKGKKPKGNGKGNGKNNGKGKGKGDKKEAKKGGKKGKQSSKKNGRG